MSTLQGEQQTTIVVQPQVAPQSGNQVYSQCPGIAKYLGFQYWPAWALIIGLVGFFCVIGGLQSIVTDCDNAYDDSDVANSCDIFEAYIFFIFYLPNILVVLVGMGIACAAHYNQTGMVIKCCLPCAMVALFIWAAVICYYLSLLNTSISIYCEDYSYNNDYICTDLQSAVSTTYAGQILLLIYLVAVTSLGCMYGCKQGNKAAQARGNAPLVVVQTTQPVYQQQPYTQQQPYVQQQYVQQQPYSQYPPQQGFAPQVYPQGYPQAYTQGYPQGYPQDQQQTA